MSFAIEVLREEWRSAFWALRNYRDPAPMPGSLARVYMRAYVAEIVRLKRLEARVKELEMETEALQVQRAQAKHDARKDNKKARGVSRGPASDDRKSNDARKFTGDDRK